MPSLRTRPATTLIELLLFMAFFALSSGVILAFFFSTSEQRMRQHSISAVEQAGVKALQSLSTRVRTAERVLVPAIGQSGGILALQIADDILNPTVVGVLTGALTVGEANTLRALTSNEVTISNLSFRNTSVTSTRASVFIQFDVTRTLPLATPITYTRSFEALIPLYPDDIESSQCGCTAPTCSNGTYFWQYCEEETCQDATVSLPCE